MECNRSSSYNMDAHGRSSLPALLESPNPNSVGEESDTCLLDGNFQGMDNMGGGAGGKSSNSSWAMKLELSDALESLQGKNGNSLLRCNSFLLDMIPADLGASAGALPMKAGGGGNMALTFPKLARQDTFSLQQAQISQTIKYLEQQQRGAMNSMRACKAEPYAGEEDDAQSSQRSSMIESCNWVSDPVAAGLPSLASESGVSELDNASLFRFSRGAMFPEAANPCGDIVENLWAY